jgi:23S rRNA (uracil1939-C5)-methyltransferase
MKNCPYAKKCSGCQLQNLLYKEQLSMKQVKLIKLLGKFCHVDEIIGMDDPYYYRNKIQSAFTFKNGKLQSGLYQSATYKIVPVESCFLEAKGTDEILKTVRQLCPSFKIKAYDLNTGSGFLRHVLIRKGFLSGEIMVVFVTAKGDFKSKRSFVNELLRRHPEITTVVWNVNPTSTPIMLGEYSEVLYGNGYITDTLCGLTFRISPRSFYQVNPIQTEKLYTLAKEFASLTGKETVIDAYSGTGTIGMTLADGAKEVIGVEINSDAVKDAKENAKLNGIKNISFEATDAKNFNKSVDVAIIDPPRKGCMPIMLETLLRLKPKRIVYVSCNAETLARDLKTLLNEYQIASPLYPYNMFPRTSHVESVICLTQK